ncbi:MAG TPA: hypothetical protein VFT74_01425, partial [Isosphaeraceae bacterium]|nr:hypothetical protein [Isosphaeraceae bacterium]
WVDARGKGAEWAFYERVGRRVPALEPLAVLYDALDRPDRWDKAPYPTPFGPVPADLAVRLFYLDRPVLWPIGLETFSDQMSQSGARSFALIARPRDEPALTRFGQVQRLEMGPSGRWDRTFALYRVDRPFSPGDRSLSPEGIVESEPRTRASKAESLLR